MKQQSRPILLLKQLAAQSLESLNQRPLQKDAANVWSGIGFSLCGQQMVAPMGEVVEIIHVPNYTFVPGVKDWMLGVANVRGRLLPVIDLECYFGARLVGNRNSHRVLIVEAGNFYVGLVVSKVFGLKHFAASSFKEVSADSSELFAQCIDGCGSDGEYDWLRFRPANLAGDASFIDASIHSKAGTAAA